MKRKTKRKKRQFRKSATCADRAKRIIQDILDNHLPRVYDALRRGYVDEKQILVIYDHAVRARVLQETATALLQLPNEP